MKTGGLEYLQHTLTESHLQEHIPSLPKKEEEEERGGYSPFPLPPIRPYPKEER